MSMSQQLIRQLNEIKGEATLYLKERSCQTDELDLILFQTLSDFLKEHGGKKKGDLYYELLRCWYYTLIQLKEEEVQTSKEEEEHHSAQDFYAFFQHRAASLSLEDKITIMYRYPWYLRTLLVTSTGTYFHEDFIHNVASMTKIEELNFDDISYLAITPYDRWAIRTIEDDLSLNHDEELTYQLTKNLLVIPYTMEHFQTFLKKGQSAVKEQDQHGLNILAFLLDIYQEEKPDMTAFQFVLFALSAMCFWHYEITTIKPKWLIKQGKFKHLKRFREELRKFR